MGLTRRTTTANNVRTPPMERGAVVIVGRYSEDRPKVALLHPDDLSMLEASHDLMQTIARLDFPSLSEAALRVQAQEDHPSETPLEDGDAIMALLDL